MKHFRGTHMNELTSLNSIARYYRQQSLSKATQRSYITGYNLFVAFCEAHGLSHMPASMETVAQFLAHEVSRGLAPMTLSARLSAIRLAHSAQGYNDPTAHEVVRSVLKGIKRETGHVVDRKKPITVELLEKLISHCGNDLQGLRDKALILVGFAGAFRRSELVNIKFEHIERTHEGMKILIPKSKTDQEGRGQTIAIPNGERLRVVDALVEWLIAANITSGYVFRRLYRSKGGLFRGANQALGDKSVERIIKRYIECVGLDIDDYSGHSLRAGFITSSAQNGADIFKMMEVSRHTNPAMVMVYVRESKLFENHAGSKFL